MGRIRSFIKRPAAAAAAFLILAVGTNSAMADDAVAEVMHFWISGSENAALQAVRQAFEDRGHTWVDNPQTGNAELRQSLVHRLSIGIPPTAIQWHANSEIDDLAGLGVIANIDGVAAREDWDAILPAAIRDLITVDGSYYLAPTNIHGENWVYSSLPALELIGRAQPTDWADFVGTMDALAAAGIRPIAVGPDAWEMRILFSSILAGTLGREKFKRLMDNRDASVLDGPEALEAFRIAAKLRRYIHTFGTYENWSAASLALARGEAGFQFMGDWAKGEMQRAGARIGHEFGCQLPPGAEDIYLLVIDSFAFPPAIDSQSSELREELASTMLDRDVQTAFSASKGSLPVRLDTLAANLDACSQVSLALLHDPEALIDPAPMNFPAEMAAEYQTLTAHFMNFDDRSPEQGLADLVALIQDSSS